MLLRTHLAFTLIFILLFLPFVNFKIVFILVSLISTLFADLDSQFSYLGRLKIFRFLQFFVKHRTVFHNLFFVLILTSLFVLFYPLLAFSFFLGYCSHLILDSFTVKGVRLFYPLKRVYSWKLRTGGKSETMFFVLVLMINIVLILSNLLSIL